MNPTILDHSFRHPGDGWYQIEALGHHPHHAANVVQVIDDEAARSIVHHFNTDAAAGGLRHGHEMLIDHEHFSDQPDQETRAYGWLQELQHRADGIYGRIRWTGTGKAAVDGGDYRFFSTEYEPTDLQPTMERGLSQSAARGQANTLESFGASVSGEALRVETTRAPKHVRPLRLAGLTLTNMNNNRGQKPITNRAPLQTTFAGANASVQTNTQTKGTSMKSVCTLLGLSAEADEIAVHAAVSRLLNRGDIAPDALAALRTEHQSLTEQTQTLLAEQSDTLLDGCGVKDERIRNRLKDGMKPLKNRAERLSYLADFGYQPGEPAKFAATSARVLNRGNSMARESFTGSSGEGDQATAIKIQNRANELQGKGLKYDAAWNQARREVLGKN